MLASYCKPARVPFVAYAQKGSSRKASRPRRSNKPLSEADHLISEYKAVKQTALTSTLASTQSINTSTATSSSTNSNASRPAPISRTLTTSTEAAAAAKARKKGFGRTKTKPSPAHSTPAAPAAPARSSSSSNTSGSGSPVAAAAAQPPAAADAATAAGASKGLPTSPPPLKVAGKRHEGFESKLTQTRKDDTTSSSSRGGETSPMQPSSPSAAAGAAAAGTWVDAADSSPRASSPTAGRALLEDSLSRLMAANEDVAAAEDHVNGLAHLLQDARSMLASLRADAAASGPPEVSSEAEHLVGIMTDLLADLSVELELVCDHLTSTRNDITSTQSQLEAAAAATTADGLAAAAVAAAPAAAEAAAALAAVEKKAAASAAAAAAAEEKAAASVAAVKQQAAAAASAASKAEQELSITKAHLEVRTAELSLLQQQHDHLQNQLTLTQQQADASAAAAASAATAAAAGSNGSSAGLDAAASDRLREVLMGQVHCNMTLLDKLGLLAQTVVGLPGLDPADRVKLASTISQCVLAVGAVALPEDLLAASDSSSNR